MVWWKDFVEDAPASAQQVRARFAAGEHSTLATVRKDGAPRISAGDSKIAGIAHETEPHRFRIEITEVVLTRVGDPADHLVIESWHSGRGLEQRLRH
jgi:hypothetical protein